MPRVATDSARRTFFLLLALLALVAVAPAPALAQEQDNPPYIHYATVSPGGLPNWGGVVTVDVNAGDDIGIAQASATVRLPDGTTQSIELLHSGDTNYTGYWDVPANYGYQTASYYFDVEVWDTGGASATGTAGQVDVEPSIAPDPPPTMSDPSVSPRELSIAGGTVRLGVTAYDSVHSTAYARVTDSNGTVFQVDLEPTTWPRFEGYLYVPGNATSTVRTYTVEMVGVDDLGQSSSIDAGQFTVAGITPDPPPALLQSNGSITPGRGPTCSARHFGARSPCAQARR
jgi:hypothetical protein